MEQKKYLNKVLIIFSDFYPEISSNLLKGAENYLKKHKFLFDKIKVPGTLEIPFIFEKYKHKYKGYIILGCVIRGETDHYDIVKDITLDFLYKKAFNEKLPLSCSILTVENYSQALERSDLKKKNLGEKSAIACLSLIRLLNEK
tara:strand:+ start:274 stop:705 length:432 start_codon:yes stop_codon:yes gene_type:complete